MPYRIDLPIGDNATLDRLVELGALDVEQSSQGGIAALMPDAVAAERVAETLGIADIVVSPASGRDAASVWVLNPRPTWIGRLRLVPADLGPQPGALSLLDSTVFGTGLHPTTTLCLEALDEVVQVSAPASVLDVGTGSGVLALSALVLGVPRADGIDVDGQALWIAGENARLNGLSDRLLLTHGGPEAITGSWPLVLANIVAGVLIEMAPMLVRRVAHHGQLVLSGIPAAVEPDVDLAYRRHGMRRIGTKSRAGWTALIMQASW